MFIRHLLCVMVGTWYYKYNDHSKICPGVYSAVGLTDKDNKTCEFFHKNRFKKACPTFLHCDTIVIQKVHA